VNPAGYPRSTGRLRAAAVGVFVIAATLVVGAIPAHAAPSTQSQAASIASQISALQPKVDAALAVYDTALDGVAQSVSQSVAARNVYLALQAQADAATRQAQLRVQALYEAGGPIGLDATALAGGSELPSDLPYLAAVVQHDTLDAASTARIAKAAELRMNAADEAIGSQLSSADVVDQRVDALQGLLAQQQQLLDQASAKVRQQADLQAAAAELAQSQAAELAAQSVAAAGVNPGTMPPLYRALFQTAATYCPGLSWTVLAAIGQVETNDGQGSMVSSAGALGPMQFLPATFAEYAVDGDRDGYVNIWDPADAIFTATRMLCANGANEGPAGLYRAIFDYNHADWYVQLVLALAAKIS
jgi:hypothetical protein